MGVDMMITLLPILFWFLILTVPFVFILRRVGLSRWWAIMGFIPLVNIIALWVFAFISWPVDKERIDPAVFGD